MREEVVVVQSTWRKKPALWVRDDTLYCSVVFTWQVESVRRYAEKYPGPVVAGGPGVQLLYPNGCDWAETPDSPSDGTDILALHNPDATFTTRGCPNRCEFCAVPYIEGEFRELLYWKPARLVCDSNLLAASRKHFRRVIDSLVGLDRVDFNQGLDARRFRSWHAGQIARLKKPTVRFALDHTSLIGKVSDAVAIAKAAGLRDIRIYVLVGFKDSPEDALHRLETVRSWGIRPNPMRYQPLDATRKDAFVPLDPGWNPRLLERVMRYYSKLRWLEHIPFEDYVPTRERMRKPWERAKDRIRRKRRSP